MNTSQKTLKDGTKIHQYKWTTDNALATLLLVHGYAEHAGRYKEFAEYLNKRDISVISYDQRGYGQSEGLRGYVSRFADYISDLAEVRKQHEGPMFLMGHSMGGTVAVQYVLTQNDTSLKGLISSSGALELDPNLSPILQRLAPILGMLLPKLQTEKLDKTYLTRDPKVLEEYMSDPLMYLKGTRARTGAEMLKAIKANGEKFKDISLPLLVLHGKGDRLTMPGGSQKLYNDASSEDKTLKLYPELYHELLNEPEREMVMSDIADWILERSK